MYPWTKRPLLCLDTETTGVNPLEDRIVQVASVSVSEDCSMSDAWEVIINPGVEIPDGAAGVHGITTERASAEGVDPAEALAGVASRIWAHCEGSEPAPVVMFNARFDWPLLISEAERHGIEWPIFAPILDPMLLDRMMDRFRKGGRKLTMVAAHYGVELSEDDAHGALADAVAAGQVMRRLLARYPQIGQHTLSWVYLRQVQGAEDDRQRFVDYRRRTSDPSFDVAPGWPIPAGAA